MVGHLTRAAPGTDRVINHGTDLGSLGLTGLPATSGGSTVSARSYGITPRQQDWQQCDKKEGQPADTHLAIVGNRPRNAPPVTQASDFRRASNS